jgi:hypothetical protein
VQARRRCGAPGPGWCVPETPWRQAGALRHCVRRPGGIDTESPVALKPISQHKPTLTRTAQPDRAAGPRSRTAQPDRAAGLRRGIAQPDPAAVSRRGIARGLRSRGRIAEARGRTAQPEAGPDPSESSPQFLAGSDHIGEASATVRLVRGYPDIGRADGPGLGHLAV